MNEARIKYADIIDREHHVSATRPPMDRLSRAAQFSPFAALTGYEDLIRESERETGSRIELSEDEKSRLDGEMSRLLQKLPSPEAAFTYFVPDEKKDGGEYVAAVGKVVKVDSLNRNLILEGGKIIPLGEIIDIESTGPGKAPEPENV